MAAASGRRARTVAGLCVIVITAASVVPVPPVRGAPAEKEVTFVTTDKVRVAGTLFGRGTVGVVLGHMLGRSQWDWYPFARRLATEGYAALAFDFRGHGKTRGRSGVEHLEREMLAAAAFLKAQGVQRVVLIGASMGGTAAVKAAAEGTASAIVVISSPMRFGADVTKADLARIDIPTLWIVGRADTDFTAPMRAMYGAVKGTKTFHEYPGNWHGTQFFNSPHSADFTARLLGFLTASVPPR